MLGKNDYVSNCLYGILMETKNIYVFNINIKIFLNKTWRKVFGCELRIQSAPATKQDENLSIESRRHTERERKLG